MSDIFETEPKWRLHLQKTFNIEADHYEHILEVKTPDDRTLGVVFPHPLTADSIMVALRQLADIIDTNYPVRTPVDSQTAEEAKCNDQG